MADEAEGCGAIIGLVVVLGILFAIIQAIVSLWYIILPAIALIVTIVVLLVARSRLIEAHEDVKRRQSDAVGVLQRRFNVLSGLFEIVAQSGRFESSLTQAAEHSSQKIAGLLSAGEARTIITDLSKYPDIKTIARYGQLMNQLLEIEREAEARFGAYNDAVKKFNTILRGIAGGMVGRSFLGLSEAEYLSVKDSDVLLPLKIDLARFGRESSRSAPVLPSSSDIGGASGNSADTKTSDD